MFVIKTNAFFAAIASVLVMKFKALEQLIKSLFTLYDYYSIRIVIMDPPVLGSRAPDRSQITISLKPT